MKIILATNNAHKVREIKEILGNKFDTVLTLREAGVEHETVEDGKTFYENALKKAREITEITGCAALADDSGLCVDILEGEPGIYSARYAASENSGNAPDADNRKKLLDKLKNVTEVSDRAAHFVSAVVLTFPDGRVLSAKGTFSGYIAFSEKGENGFGYDSIFFVPEKNKTVAEMSESEKNSLSHRGKALRALEKQL